MEENEKGERKKKEGVRLRTKQARCWKERNEEKAGEGEEDGREQQIYWSPIPSRIY